MSSSKQRKNKSTRTSPYLLRNKVIQIELCIDCKRHYGTIENIRCTRCHFNFEHPEHEQKLQAQIDQEMKLADSKETHSIEEINAITDRDIRKRMIQSNLGSIFKHWRTEQLTKSTMIRSTYVGQPSYKRVIPVRPTYNQCVIIKKKVKALRNHTNIYKYLHGENEWKQAFILDAKDADELLNYFLIEVCNNEYGYHDYTNAIGPFIFDVWNTTCQASTHLCYFKNLGELNSLPDQLKKIYECWDRCNNDTYRGFANFRD